MSNKIVNGTLGDQLRLEMSRRLFQLEANREKFENDPTISTFMGLVNLMAGCCVDVQTGIEFKEKPLKEGEKQGAPLEAKVAAVMQFARLNGFIMTSNDNVYTIKFKDDGNEK